MTEPTGRCTSCRKRDPRYGLVCDACRSRIASWLRDIPVLHAELEQRDDPQRQPRDEREGTRAARVRDGDGRSVIVRVPGYPADPAASTAPAGSVPGPGKGGRVSGSRETPTPLRIDPADLTASARVLALTNLRERYRSPPYAEHHADQIGHLPVATVLDGWVRDWRGLRDRGEGLPDPTVPELAAWLGNRVEWACDEHPAIGECMDELGQVRSVLRGALGLIEVPDYKYGVPCPACDALTLVRLNGSEWIECDCGELMSPDEYEKWVALLAADIRQGNVVPDA